MPVLHVLVGPNGAGKSTLYDKVLGPVTHLPFVNADVMYATEAERFADEYQAGAAAAVERNARIDRRESFVTETVFSHPSKLDLLATATDAGYQVHLHVAVVPVDLTVRRVAERVRRGGHGVAEDKIRSRYERLWANVSASVGCVREITIYDNSSARRPLRVVANLLDGHHTRPPAWPDWMPDEIRELA